jgi:acetoacetate decarboxylase
MKLTDTRLASMPLASPPHPRDAGRFIDREYLYLAP